MHDWTPIFDDFDAFNRTVLLHPSGTVCSYFVGKFHAPLPNKTLLFNIGVFKTESLNQLLDLNEFYDDYKAHLSRGFERFN